MSSQQQQCRFRPEWDIHRKREIIVNFGKDWGVQKAGEMEVNDRHPLLTLLVGELEGSGKDVQTRDRD